MRINFQAFGIEIGAILNARRVLRTPIAGITNRCSDGKYITFLDYDNIPYEWLKDELLAIQKEFDLKQIYLFKSSEESFHVICFEKMNREEYEKILHRSSCDPGYKKVPWAWGKRVATLRVSEKRGTTPTFMELLDRDAIPSRELSTAHIKFFEKNYKIETPCGMQDGNEELIMARYRI
jgi:hypothetical protein